MHFLHIGWEERKVIEIVVEIYDYIFKYIIIIISNTDCEEGEKKYVVFCHNCHTPIFFRTFAPRMEKIRFDVVGLYHWDVRDHWKEYAAEAVGKTLTLQPQPENVKDPYAVRAREGAVHVGYVAVTDLDVVYQALKGCGKERLKGVVVRSNTEPPVLTVECEVERVDWDYEPFDDSVYAGWHYDGLSLMPRKMEQLQDLVDDIIDDLDPNMDSHRSDSTGENLRSLVETLLDTHLYDMSREMTRARYRVERLLSDRETSFLSEQLDQLRLQKGMLMCHEYRDRVARYLFLELPRELRRKGLEDSHYTYDNRLDELKSQLSSFPYQLYDKFLCDPVDFLREVYYHHVPRKYLFQLLSGIILMILKGQVQIQRWGREGDMEPLDLIAFFRETTQIKATDREQAIKEVIISLLNKEDARGNRIISQKNQWAAMMSVLVFEYSVTNCDMKAFCRKMDEWGFGADSGLEVYCDYDSIAKCSEYALNHFREWRGEGTKHKRMVSAAVELRGILRSVIGFH